MRKVMPPAYWIRYFLCLTNKRFHKRIVSPELVHEMNAWRESLAHDLVEPTDARATYSMLIFCLDSDGDIMLDTVDA